MRLPLKSFAQNGEDIVLRRALGNIATGRYVDVGANDPTHLSISRLFYDLGWRGLVVEPVHAFAEAFREQRPGDIVIEKAITDADVDSITLHQFDDTGLSTTVDAVAHRHEGGLFAQHEVEVAAASLDSVLRAEGFDGLDIHFMTIDVEGAEERVLRSFDLRTWRPWVLLVESTAPLDNQPTHGSWEHLVLDAGYEFCLFDGLSRYYVAAEHAATLGRALGYPACGLDFYERPQEWELRDERDALKAENDTLRGTIAQLTADLIRWRDAAVRRWAEGAGRAPVQTDHGALRELEAMRQTVSWRITAPLRTVRTRSPRRGPRA